MQTLRVAAGSKPEALSWAIFNVLNRDGITELMAIGAQAVHEATKAIILAKSQLATSGRTVACVPSFQDVAVEEAHEPTGDVKTAIRWIVRAVPEWVEPQAVAPPTPSDVAVSSELPPVAAVPLPPLTRCGLPLVPATPRPQTP